MNSRSPLPAILLAGLVLLGPGPTTLSGASAGRTFPSAVKRSLDEEARLVVNLLQNYHYSGRGFGDVTNTEIIDRFLKSLDSDQLILSQSDIDFIHRRFGQTLKTVYIYKGDMQPAQEIYALLIERARRRFDWIEKRLSEPFDLTTDRTMSAADIAPSADPAAEDRRWELRLTSERIDAMLAGRTEQQARDYLIDFYHKSSGYMAGFDPYEVRALFLDAIIQSFDPRSGYFSADSTKEFALEMAGAVTGIGIEVSKEGGRCYIDSVHPGGPADLDSDLQPGDELIEVSNAGDAPSPVANMRLREVTDLLRGADGTSVTIKYRREGGGGDTVITIKRSRVTLIQNRAFASVHVLPTADGHDMRIGVIVFPTFYGSPEEGGSSVSADVGELLGKLDAAGIAGLVIDLRGNPGGNMEEAVKVCSLFLHSGFAARSRTSDGATKAFPIVPGRNVYDGPLVVLTSVTSASASELFSGAIQAHHRGIVMGGTTTGKGTVQSYIPLDKNYGGDSHPDWGTLRLTYAMFNLPDGRPIQQQGIEPDIKIPVRGEKGYRREIELDHSLQPVPIDVPQGGSAAPPLAVAGDGARMRKITETVNSDLENLPEWSLWRDEDEFWWGNKDANPSSLSFEKRRTEYDESTAKAESLVARRRALMASDPQEVVPIDLDSTLEALRAHGERLRALIGEKQPDPLIRLEKGGIIVLTPHGHLRRLRWSSFNIARYKGLAGELAEAFNSGAGTRMSKESMGVIIAELALQEHPNDQTALRVFESHLPGGIAPVAVQTGIDAMLAKILEINPDLQAERWTFDVPLREAVRAAACWAGNAPVAHESAPAVP